MEESTSINTLTLCLKERNHSLSLPYPLQNGIAKLKNGHLLKIIRALIFQMNVSK